MRPRPLWTFLYGSMRWMLAVSRATAPPWNLSKNTPGTKVFFCSAPKRHKPCLLIIPSELRPRKDRKKTTRRVGGIKIVTLAAPAAPGLKAPPRPLRSTQPRLWLEMIVIMAATSQRIGKIRTWAWPPVTIITRKSILLTNVLCLTSLKTSIGLDNLFAGD